MQPEEGVEGLQLIGRWERGKMAMFGVGNPMGWLSGSGLVNLVGRKRWEEWSLGGGAGNARSVGDVLYPYHSRSICEFYCRSSLENLERN